jgi:hypothetical protein
MSETEAFRRLDKLFRRLSLMKLEMMGPDVYVVDAVIHNGMGDFSNFQSRKPTLSEATEDVLMQYCESRGVGRAELERWFNEN